MPRGVDEHQVEKRSFAFSIVYIKCFRTYSMYLSLRLPAQILYAGIHLPPQREARALPRHAQIFPLRFRQRGDTYPFSFGTKRKAVRRCRKVSPPTFSLAFLHKCYQGVGLPLCRSPLTLRLRYSRVRGRRQSKFLASSSTGGARNFYPKGGINAPPEAVWFLISTASPTGSRADFRFPSDARPPEALRASRGYLF